PLPKWGEGAHRVCGISREPLWRFMPTVFVKPFSHDGGLRGHGVRRRPAPERAGLWHAAVPDVGRPLAHLRPDERGEPRPRLLLHAGRVLRAVVLPPPP